MKTEHDETQTTEEGRKQGFRSVNLLSTDRWSAKIAVYDFSDNEPSVAELEEPKTGGLVGSLSTAVFEASAKKGGRVPFSVVHALIENLVHADFRSVVVSILNDGNTIRVSDNGPGIENKTRALDVGFSSASPTTSAHIKGVGAGLPTALACMKSLGGSLTIDDNLDRGTVVTVEAPPDTEKQPAAVQTPPSTPRIELSKRQKQAFFIIVELGSVGPSQLAAELSIGLSTAHRDLQALEGAGLIRCANNGKRSLTDYGTKSVDAIIDL